MGFPGKKLEQRGADLSKGQFSFSSDNANTNGIFERLKGIIVSFMNYMSTSQFHVWSTWSI